ncbi:cutinase [Acephala macrosclerotiorum]|nr:cutinase [Acephala macrosclerotiorum]
MIVARASTEQPGQGIIGAVATQVQQQVPGSDSEAVDYPATLTDYLNSEASGVAAMTKLVENYAARCPNSKMALLGYSQGAQVVGDMMCGTSETNFNSTQPLSAALSKNIVAIVQMGDPTHVPNLSQDVGNSTKTGIFPRKNTTCGNSAAITQSYCNANDKFCDSGNSIQVHISYVQVFGTQAAQFIVGKVGGNSTSNSTVKAA